MAHAGSPSVLGENWVGSRLALPGFMLLPLTVALLINADPQFVIRAAPVPPEVVTPEDFAKTVLAPLGSLKTTDVSDDMHSHVVWSVRFKGIRRVLGIQCREIVEVTDFPQNHWRCRVSNAPRLPDGTEAHFHLPSGALTDFNLPEKHSVTLGGYLCRRNVAVFADGSPAFCELARQTRVAGLDVPTGTILRFVAGRLEYVNVPAPKAPTQFMGREWGPEYSRCGTLDFSFDEKRVLQMPRALSDETCCD